MALVQVPLVGRAAAAPYSMAATGLLLRPSRKEAAAAGRQQREWPQLTVRWCGCVSATRAAARMHACVECGVECCVGYFAVPFDYGALRQLASDAAQDYMVYWAKLSGKGADIGRLQRWLLEDPGRTARICNPFSETEHTLLLRSASAAAEAARLTTSAANINVDGTFAAAVRRALAAAPGAGGARQAAHVALALSTAAFDLRMHEEALQLLQRAAKEFVAAGGGAGDARLLHSQLEFSQAQALHALGRPSDAMRVLESVLKVAQVGPPAMPPRSGPCFSLDRLDFRVAIGGSCLSASV